MSNIVRKPVERARGERLKTCITAERKTLVQRAAELEGRTVTDDVIASVQDAARRTVEAHGTIVLSAADSRAFVNGRYRRPSRSAAGQRPPAGQRAPLP